MLPAAACPAHTTLAGSALLRSRAADGDNLVGISRALCRSSVRAVARLRLRCRSSSVAFSFCADRFSFLFRRGGSDSREFAAFDEERRRCRTNCASRQKADDEKYRARDDGQEKLGFAKAWRAV